LSRARVNQKHVTTSRAATEQAQRRQTAPIAARSRRCRTSSNLNQSFDTFQDAWKIGRKDGVAFTGVEVDMHHILVETVERTLDDVLERFDPDPMKHNFVGGLLHAIPLHGEATVTAWQERAATYPDGLRRAVVQAHAQIEGFWRLDAYAIRANPVAGYHLLTSAHERSCTHCPGSIARLLPGFRSLEALVADLRLAPRGLLERLRASFPLQPERSKQILTGLVEDTHHLIATLLPALDVDRLRTLLRYERPIWDGA
jgi:hypothetical protein